jgi:hypothetical protein
MSMRRWSASIISDNTQHPLTAIRQGPTIDPTWNGQHAERPVDCVQDRINTPRIS